MKLSPCYGCTVRSSCCHSKCGEYAQWYNELQEYNKEKQKRRSQEYVSKAQYFKNRYCI